MSGVPDLMRYLNREMRGGMIDRTSNKMGSCGSRWIERSDGPCSSRPSGLNCLRPDHFYVNYDGLEKIFSYLHMKTSEVGNFLGEVPFVINGAWRHVLRLQDTVRDCDAMVLVTESGRLVHDTRSIGVSYIGVNEHPKGFILKLKSHLT
jgi:hypothetical protein